MASCRRAGAILRLVTALLILCPSVASAQGLPIPDNYKFGVRSDDASLRYCLDSRERDWPVTDDIGRALAEALLLEPKPYRISDALAVAELDMLQGFFLEHCDIYMSFKLVPGGYPEWLTVSRAYYSAAYVFVTADPAWRSLGQIPLSQAIGATLGTTGDLRLIQYLQALQPSQRWPRYPMGTNEATLQALRAGTIGAALVWEPSLWSPAGLENVLAGLRVIASDPLPRSILGVGAAMLSDATYLRANLDRAIAALVQDGSIQAILDRHRFPARAGGD